ncbi:hypothetical protein AVV36_gp275 [Pectobacterium bacteriophage PM2]|uniref:Uncharacterized protein n=1 Tax=Pectobacterium bacteriophage PM2 TaxID=1429794 RepID=A0A0A0Q2G1_9CAUD|nr:hypothetical protein AVV36_gp275 [Pectobacterium bacteriophage PM2]AHY25135.1 hypothetical protein PM2_173 [Pectobacterium bacteriophage PM2]
MATIIPLNTALEDKIEGSSIDITFTYILEENEVFKSINIIQYEPTPGIIISGARLHGSYNSVFSFSGDALLYRQNNELKSASAWELLPPPKEADLYLWRAPTNLQKVFNYTVELVYTIKDTSEPGSGTSTTPEVEEKIQKIYSQTVVGNWSLWANQLREYVYAGE